MEQLCTSHKPAIQISPSMVSIGRAYLPRLSSEHTPRYGISNVWGEYQVNTHPGVVVYLFFLPPDSPSLYFLLSSPHLSILPPTSSPSLHSYPPPLPSSPPLLSPPLSPSLLPPSLLTNLHFTKGMIYSTLLGCITTPTLAR